MKEFIKIGDHYVKDAQARDDIEAIKTNMKGVMESLNNFSASSEVQAALSDYVQKSDVAQSDQAGVVMIDAPYGIYFPNGKNAPIGVNKITESDLIGRTNVYRPVVAAMLDKSVMYALSDCKDTSLWTDDTTAEDGTVTKGTKTKARELLGAISSAYVDNLPDNLTLDETAQSKWRDMIGAGSSNIQTITQEEYDALESPETGVTYIIVDGEEYRRYTHAISVRESIFLTLETTDKTAYTGFYDNGDHMLARALWSKGYRGNWLICPASGVVQSNNILYITYGVYVAADDSGIFDYTKLVECYYFINLTTSTLGTGETSVSLSDIDANTPAVEDAVSDI